MVVAVKSFDELEVKFEELGKTTMGNVAMSLTDEDRMRMTEGSGAAMARAMGQVITGPTTLPNSVAPGADPNARRP